MNKSELKFKISPALSIEIFWRDKMRACFPCHFHKHYVIGCLLRGERLYKYNGYYRKLHPYQIVFINPGQIHQCQCSGKTAATWLAIHFPVQTMRNLLSENNEIVKPPIFSLPVLSDNVALEKLLALSLNPSARNAQALLNYIWNLHIFNFSENDEYSLLQVKYCESDLLIAIRAIYTQFISTPQQNLSLAEMALKANMSKFTFLRKFKKIMGLSPCRYLDLLRLNLARDRLGQGQSISQCAQNCGYYDQSHLHKQFAANFDFTPGHLQKAVFLAEKER